MNKKTAEFYTHKHLSTASSNKISFLSIFKILGILLQVPAIMTLLSLSIALIYQEYFALFPLLLFAFFTFLIGQILYRCFFHHNLHNLKEAMIGAALGWAFCSLLGAIPYWLISQKLLALGIQNEPVHTFSSFLNSLFESVSGFTSTGHHDLFS